MPYLLVIHKVEDYAKWKSGFDDGVALREATDSKGGYIFRSADDPNEVVVLLEYDDLEKARQHAQSEELRERMQQSGVVGKPEVYFLEVAARPAI